MNPNPTVSCFSPFPYCGCPEIPKGACNICGNDHSQRVSSSDSNVFVEDYLPIQLLGIEDPTTCEMVESFLHSSTLTGSPECLEGQALRDRCHCEPQQIAAAVPETDHVVAAEGSNMCSLCWDASPVRFREKNITQYLPDEVLLELGVDHLTCGLLESAALEGHEEGSSKCSQAQEFAGICGCPPVPENECTFCLGEDVDRPDYVVQSVQYYGYPPISCRDMQLSATQLHDGTRECHDANSHGFLCGCNHGKSALSPSSSTSAQDHGIIWASRLAAVLSIFGSLYIVVDIFLQRKKGITSRQEILVFMHCFDFINSVTWALGPILVPQENEYGESTGVYNAHGTEATCKGGGFAIQLGLTAAFYNSVLATYYMLVVRYGEKNESNES